LTAEPFPKSVILEIPATNTPTFFLLVPSPDSRRELGDREPRLPPTAGDAPPFLPADGDGCRYLEGTTIAGSLAALRFSSLAATRLGTTHLDGAGDVALGVPLTAGEDAREVALLTEGDGARELPPFTDDDGCRCLDGAGDENRRLTAEAAEAPCGGAASVFLGARTVLLTASESWMLEPDEGMSGGAAADGDATGWMT
jgi:hypothetical protein